MVQMPAASCSPHGSQQPAPAGPPQGECGPPPVLGVDNPLDTPPVPALSDTSTGGESLTSSPSDVRDPTTSHTSPDNLSAAGSWRGDGGGSSSTQPGDLQERIDLLEREKKVLHYHNQFLKEELESHKRQMAELQRTIAELRVRNSRYQEILNSYEHLTAAGLKTIERSRQVEERSRCGADRMDLVLQHSYSMTSEDGSEKAPPTPTSSNESSHQSHHFPPNLTPQHSFSRDRPPPPAHVASSPFHPGDRSNSLEFIQQETPPPATITPTFSPSTHHNLSYRTLPPPVRGRGNSTLTRAGSYHERKALPPVPHPPNTPVRSVVGGDKSCSVPNLAENYVNMPGTAKLGQSATAVPLEQTTAATTPKRSSSFLKLFRRNSGKRGTSTDGRNSVPAGTPISRPLTLHPPGVSFHEWDSSQLSQWLHQLGLGAYAQHLNPSITGGNLVQCAPHQLEKVLQMKNHLVRKKVMLAIRSQVTNTPNPVDEIDHNWVARWLDDIGLPQHKESFIDCRVDGRVLYYLTFDDLISLKVVSALHQISIGRAVQCLRIQQWNPQCLIRRPTDPATAAAGPPDDLLLWTNHRIMDWLRSIDLCEYAPNLRGSGVHGALMCLEPRFVGETLCDVLCIPNSKTLLRRHLVTHFNQLVGRPCQELKRMIEASGHFQPLSPSIKVKPPPSKRGSARRRSRDRGGALDDLVCPLAFEVPNFIPAHILPIGYFIPGQHFTNIPVSPEY